MASNTPTSKDFERARAWCHGEPGRQLRRSPTTEPYDVSVAAQAYADERSRIVARIRREADESSVTDERVYLRVMADRIEQEAGGDDGES